MPTCIPTLVFIIHVATLAQTLNNMSQCYSKFEHRGSILPPSDQGHIATVPYYHSIYVF